MKQQTEKQRQRAQRKLKKIVALVEATRLNDKDRKAKAESTINNQKSTEMSSPLSPSRKRPCVNPQEDTKPTSPVVDVTPEANGETSNDLANKKPRLSGDEYLQLKQELRERKKILTSIPRLRLRAVGDNASLCIDAKSRIPIFLNDIQHLLMYSLLGHHSPHSPERWCHLEKFNKVSHTVVLIVEGLSLFHFSNNESIFTNINKNMEHRMEIVTPATYGGSIVEDLAAVPLTGTEKNKLIKKFGSLEAAMKSTGDLVKLLKIVFPMKPQTTQDGQLIDRISILSDLPKSDKFSRTQLLLSPEQLVELNYPLPLQGGLAEKYKDYVLTKDEYLEATPKSPMFGLDCEMCRTTLGIPELTRISIVDENLNLFYESFVKPDNKITDYLTRFSGITPALLKNVTTRLSDVQNELRKILPADAILVGQSLNFDLQSLKMMHPYIIDTSIIFNITGKRLIKSKLKVLSDLFLCETIQDSQSGHCSLEDSRASLKLAQLKLKNNINFGDAVMMDFLELQQTIDDIRKNNQGNNKNIKLDDLEKYGVSIFNHMTKVKDMSSTIIGNKEVMNEYSMYLKNTKLNVMDDANFDKTDQVRLVLTDSNKQSIKRASEISMEHALTFCHVKLDSQQTNDDNIEKTCKKVDKWISKLWKSTADKGLLCVVFGGEKNAANGACFLNIKRQQLLL
ncbi:hypothetical protein HCN44_006635 [Aphidius gifuensis]|uniref:Exonuclease domain-containing protein n=1 Tax=Aphidius gifuensis TaxID=684658 RepID=A0A834Y0J0_APHGI|nr:RNA exonuclease 1-like isoform X2 [Aphidius gifuensis]XP_044004985.1 RNA exonuclease 1-like isoform X2 [Aphidius gifuensis]KAF7995528.1 hypothetical protein HCN44_006635 [Aphidius gifuensis]